MKGNLSKSVIIKSIDDSIEFIITRVTRGSTSPPQELYATLFKELHDHGYDAKEILKIYMENKVLPLGKYPFDFTEHEYDKHIIDLSKFKSKRKSKRKSKSKTRKSKSKTRKSKSKSKTRK